MLITDLLGNGEEHWVDPQGFSTNIPSTTGKDLSMGLGRDMDRSLIGSYTPSTGSLLVTGDPPSALQQRVSSVCERSSDSTLRSASYIGLHHESPASTLDHSFHITRPLPDIQHCSGLPLWWLGHHASSVQHLGPWARTFLGNAPDWLGLSSRTQPYGSNLATPRRLTTPLW